MSGRNFILDENSPEIPKLVFTEFGRSVQISLFLFASAYKNSRQLTENENEFNN